MSLFRTIFILIFTVISHTTWSQKAPIILELFTSQGCSSCPSADHLLSKYKEKYPEIHVLSYHVDYWNHLGWKDPFSHAQYSAYQAEYCQQLNSEYVYTPQLILNGMNHFVGSHQEKIDLAIQNSRSTISQNKLQILNCTRKEKEVILNFKNLENNTYTIFCIVVDQKKTNVLKGENIHRILVNHNVVASQKIIQNKKQGKIRLPIPNWIAKTDNIHLIAYNKNASLEITNVTKINIDL